MLPRRHLLLALPALALAMRLWVVRSLRFDGLYGQDAFAYYYHGLALWRDHALRYHWPWLPRPLPLFFPLGEPALLAAIFALARRPDPTLALAASVACGVIGVALVYDLAHRVARDLFTPRAAGWTAALAAAPIAIAGLQIQASATIMSDAPALFWGLAALWLWTSPRAGGPARPAAFAAGVCLALAVSTRWEYAALAPAMVAYWWVWRGPAGDRTRTAGPIVAGALGALPASIPQLLYSLHDSDPVLHHQWLTGWSPAHLWQASFATVDGMQHYPMSAGAFYLLRPLLSPQTLPLVLAPFLPAGIAALAAGCGERGRAAARPWLVLLLCWWLIPALYLSGVPFESARFTLIYIPPLAMLEALGLVAAAGVLGRLAVPRPPSVSTLPPSGRARRPGGAAILAVLWATIGLGMLAADARDGVAALAHGKEGDLAAVSWLRGHAPPGAPIATFSLTLMLYHYGDPAAHGWTLLDLSAASARDLARVARDPSLTVVVDEGNLAAQWRGLPPQRAFATLRAGAHLRPVGRAGPYTIFRR